MGVAINGWAQVLRIPKSDTSLHILQRFIGEDGRKQFLSTDLTCFY